MGILEYEMERSRFLSAQRAAQNAYYDQLTGEQRSLNSMSLQNGLAPQSLAQHLPTPDQMTRPDPSAPPEQNKLLLLL